MSDTNEFNQDEKKRYARHFKLESVGVAGQKKLKNARVLCVGAGGLGSPLLLYLAAAGVGTIGIIDDDTIALSNLQRQVLYETSQTGQSKTVTAAERLQRLNPHVNVITYPLRLTAENADAIIREFDIVADGSDLFETRYLVNYSCVRNNKILVSASVTDFKGQCTVIDPAHGPCYNCLFPANQGEDQLPNCEDRGILGAVPGVLGTIQATEVTKVIVGIGEPLIGKLLQIDMLTWQTSVLNYNKDNDCAVCDQQAQTSFSYAPLQISTALEINAGEWIRVRDGAVVIDVREPAEHQAYNIGGRNIPLSQLAGHTGDISKDARVLVYCQAGIRSKKAVGILKELGFSNVVSLAGGVNNFEAV